MAETTVVEGPLTVASRLTKGGGDVNVNPVVYTVAGAIQLVPGLHRITGTAKAMTLAVPTAALEGAVMTIYSFTPAAHTVTAAGGYGGAAGLPLATFSATSKNILQVMAVNLNWTILNNVGIVISA